MELNSLLILLEAAEYLERRDREAEHGYASVLPYSSDFSSKKTKTSPISRKTQNNRSSHNELEKHRPQQQHLSEPFDELWQWEGEPSTTPVTSPLYLLLFVSLFFSPETTSVFSVIFFSPPLSSFLLLPPKKSARVSRNLRH
uniref:MAX dimerization protein 4 n=1 Tax=Scophthalmus maximus TaxID=52904 RepID=A0A8D3CSC7_SCOMX